mmetsp:Transcript_27182/g.69040  ORF Transcript_27182/g.69040 Transcript_27182/m.69040 type:complete len:206 (+) Transcript_27182:2451-3068(+)
MAFPAGVLPPTGCKFQQGLHIVRLVLEDLLELLPGVSKLAFSHQQLTIGDLAPRGHAVQLDEFTMALLLPSGVLHLLVDLQEQVPELSIVGNLTHGTLQSLLRVLPQANAFLDFGHLHVDFPGFPGTGAALQRTPQIVHRLARTCIAPRCIELGKVQAAVVITRPYVKQPLEPVDCVLIPTGLPAQMGQRLDGRRIGGLQHQSLL